MLPWGYQVGLLHLTEQQLLRLQCHLWGSGGFNDYWQTRIASQVFDLVCDFCLCEIDLSIDPHWAEIANRLEIRSIPMT